MSYDAADDQENEEASRNDLAYGALRLLTRVTHKMRGERMTR
jgi:hypothetical protein